jgi:hypothetical protein
MSTRPFLTFRQLKEAINSLTDEDLDKDVVLYDESEDEMIGVVGLGITGVPNSDVEVTDDLFDDGQPYLYWKMPQETYAHTPDDWRRYWRGILPTKLG